MTSLTDFAYTCSGGDQRLRIRRDQPDFFDRVIVQSGEDTFWVRRTKPDAPYYVERLSEAEKGRRVVPNEYKMDVMGAPYCPPGNSYFLVLRKLPDCKVQKVVPIQEGGKTLIRASYLYGDEQYPKVEGWLCVDPSRNWVVRSYEFKIQTAFRTKKNVRLENAYRLSGSVVYADSNGTPVPSEIEYSSERDGRLHFKRRFVISKFLVGPSPRESFTLAVFGLGDAQRKIDSVKRRDTYWTAAVGGSAFLIGFVLLCIGRAVQKRKSSSPRAIRTPPQ